MELAGHGLQLIANEEASFMSACKGLMFGLEFANGMILAFFDTNRLAMLGLGRCGTNGLWFQTQHLETWSQQVMQHRLETWSPQDFPFCCHFESPDI